MKVTTDHCLDVALSEPIPGGSSMPVRRAVVIHFTNGATAKSSIEYWRKLGTGVCAHLIIDRDGTIYQCRPFDRTAGHAGVSRWKDPNTGKLYVGMNSCSIGIELANAGEEETVAKRWSKLPLVTLKHRNGGPVMKWEQFPKAQIAACTETVQVLVARYNLDDITGHDCIAPERKVDPGPAFPMEELRVACGFHGSPEVYWH